MNNIKFKKTDDNKVVFFKEGTIDNSAIILNDLIEKLSEKDKITKFKLKFENNMFSLEVQL